jgi:hypothetical protein
LKSAFLFGLLILLSAVALAQPPGGTAAIVEGPNTFVQQQTFDVPAVFMESGCISGIPGADILCADSTSHRFKITLNNGTAVFVPGISPGANGHVPVFDSTGYNLVDSNTVPGNGTLTLPIYLNTTTPTSQSNECQFVSDAQGGTVTATPVMRTVDASSVGHDVMCAVTAASNSTQVGSIIFPYYSSFGAIDSSLNGVGSLDVGKPGTTASNGIGGLLVLTDTGGVVRRVGIHFRACNGPGIGVSCGTDFIMEEDPLHLAREEMSAGFVGDGTALYIGSVLNSTYPGICFGGSDARAAGLLCIDRVLGQPSHFVRHTTNADMWGTVTMASGVASYTFGRSFSSTPIVTYSWQGGTLNGTKVTPVISASGFSLTSSNTSDTATFAYTVMGNPN